MNIIKKIKRRINLAIIAIVKYLLFNWTMKIRNKFYKYVLKDMGRDCNITDAVTITSPQNVSLGDNVSIHPYCYFSGMGEINIGNYVAIANGTTIICETHNFSEIDKFIKHQGLTEQPITIEDDVWIGSRVIILGNIRNRYKEL